MKVVINPTEDEKKSGLTSVANWHSDDVIAHLRVIFGIKLNEHISQIEVDKDRITVRIGTRP
jgi:hypothetical protein